MWFAPTFIAPSSWLLWSFAAILLSALIWAIYKAPWSSIVASNRHIYGVTVVVLALFWSLSVSFEQIVSFRFSGIATIFLMFGWAVGILISTISLVIVALTNSYTWSATLLNGFFGILLPISICFSVLLLFRHYLPRHFFIFIFGNAFFASALATLIACFGTMGWLIWTQPDVYTRTMYAIMPFFPLISIPEGFINGMLTTLIVVYRPTWIRYAFQDNDYLNR